MTAAGGLYCLSVAVAPTVGAGRAVIGISLQEISHATGLSKSAVQAAVKRLKQRRLISGQPAGDDPGAQLSDPMPWRD